MTSVREQLMQMWVDLQQTVVEWAPRVVLGLILIVVALIAAKLAEKIVRAILVRLRFDSLVEKAGVDQALQKIGIRQSIDVFVPRVLYFILLFLFARTAADSLGLGPISEAMASFMAYLPNLIAALLILVLGSAAAQFAGRAVTEAATNAGIDFAPALGRVVSATLLFVLGIMAIGQLKIDTDIIRLVTSAVLAAFALAFGLSFGLGSRDVTRNILAGFYARKTFQMGEELEVSGERGTLTAITPTQTILQQDDRIVTVANTVFLDEVVKQ